MRINAIGSSYTGTAFKSPKKEYENTQAAPVKDGSKKISTGLKGLAVLGVVLAGYSVMKKNNIDPKSLLNNVKEKFSDKPAPDPIIKKLNGRRDAEAVKIYNGCKAQQKLESLRIKNLNGELNNKPDKVYKYIIENQAKLERAAQFAV